MTPKKKLVPVTQETYREIDKLAKKLSMSYSQLIAHLIDFYYTAE